MASHVRSIGSLPPTEGRLAPSRAGISSGQVGPAEAA
jgi:hypothetical protein